ncbi:MFS transporter [Streptomyces sp. NPDC098101]|uniref:MFS transporter n=1 Tax=Streptomyces sp. NPDC098101 TaxID=3366096 RepID=UPI00380F01A7
MKKRYSLPLHLTGAAVARTGDEMSGPALMLAGFALTGSAADASLLLAGVTVSAVLGGPVLGSFLDRARRPGRLLAVALALYAAGLTAVLMGLGRLPFGLTLALAVLTGLLGPALSGGWTAQLPAVVGADRLARANALDAMTFSAAGLAGPVLAGGVAEVLGAPTAVVVSTVLIALALPAAWTLPVRIDPLPGTPVPGGPVTSLTADLAAGRPALARATLTSVVSCAAQGMSTACLPLLGERVLGGPGHGAMLLSCTAASALAAHAVLARFPRAIAPDTLLWAGALVQAVASASAASGHPFVLVAAALVAGIGEGPQLTGLFAVRHREAPEHLRSQVFTTGASLKITGFALGAAVAGPVASGSLPGALLLAAGTAALAALAFFAVPAPGGRTVSE